MPDLVRAAFLQSMLAHRHVSDKQGRALYEGACEVAKSPYESAEFDDFLHEASAAISSFGLEFRRMPDPWTGRGMIALVNTKGDEIAQMATHCSPAEIALLKTMIEEIFTAPNESYSASSTSILNLATSQKPTSITKKAAEQLISNLVHDGWIHRSSRTGNVSLTSRALLELQTYLKETYPGNVLKCRECQHIVTRGLACKKSKCSVRVHAMCESLAVSERNKKCPGCQAAWEPLPVGEERIEGSRGRRQRGRARDARADNEGSDEEEEEAFQDAHSENGDAQHEEEDASDSFRGEKRRRRPSASTSTSRRASARRVPSSDDGSDEQADGAAQDGEDEDEDEDEDEEQPVVKRRRPS